MTAHGRLSLEDNIFLAKRNLVDSIWKEARLEGIAVTYPQTADVLAFAWTCRSQLFRDGNKRTAQLIANDILIHSGEGILAVPIDSQDEFFGLLVAFYESNIPDELISFLREKCIEKPAIGKADTC
ncbi:hypothetical protein [Adlercreutzia murintestinalis]|uniref:hypothetical protein n=1 Tax=Adlercreutzia murintestinalis TaxID=2941325 RepID=UPI00203AFAA2|nr:hypothetical protein [Adlercreutzia murintestinalis]